jgi:creatinine amidohydrolase
MKWEELTVPAFEKALISSEGVCVLPLGVLEKHGEHLPVGTDLIIARMVANLAADIEPAVVFPDYYFTQIHEAKQYVGAIALKGRLMMDLLENVCDEIARNGFKKIVFFNYHGGNEAFLAFFLQLFLEKQKPYMIYWLRGYQSPEFQETWNQIRGSVEDGHAGESETSIIQYLTPDLFKKEQIAPEAGTALKRLSHLPNLSTPIDWYANYPRHYAGDGHYGTEEKGRKSVEDLTNYLAKAIRNIKKDTVTPGLYKEYFQSIQHS